MIREAMRSLQDRDRQEECHHEHGPPASVSEQYNIWRVIAQIHQVYLSISNTVEGNKLKRFLTGLHALVKNETERVHFTEEKRRRGRKWNSYELVP